MRFFFLLVGAALALITRPLAAGEDRDRERLPFNDSWLFFKGDEAGAAQSDFNDSSWTKVRLPHDWSISGPFQYEYPGDTGRLKYWGPVWYRKHFVVPAGDSGRRVYLDVDGAMSNATVFLNGHSVGGWPYGYASWRVDLTPYLRTGEENTLAIRLDSPPDSSRWYPGAGIYRNVWLVKTNPVHIGLWGVFVTTPEITVDSAKVVARVTVDNASSAGAEVSATTRIYEADANDRPTGEAVAATPASDKFKISPGGSATVTLVTDVPHPKLWDLKSPNRYLAVTTIEQDGRVVDTYSVPFGIRSMEFTVEDGFHLNGHRVQIRGVCNHHDLGALGTAINSRALERQIDLLQEMGCNAIRTSHNPPAPELLDLCDRKGMLVMDEAFDAWIHPKRPHDYATVFPEWHEKDLRAFIRRDRNHPSVAIWSIGNEVHKEQETPDGHEVARELAGIVHSEDPSRPVTSGCNKKSAATNGFQKLLDVYGCNYKSMLYGDFRRANPSQPLIGTETASSISSRGEYFFPVTTQLVDAKEDFQVSSYDNIGRTYQMFYPELADPKEGAKVWGSQAESEFKGLDAYPFVAGEFVWTGFDYLGEPHPYNRGVKDQIKLSKPEVKARLEKTLRESGKIDVPSRSSYFGIFDLAGFKKDRFFLYQSRWRPELPMVHIFPHWNWPERVGQVTPVHVYTSGDEAELFLNGKSLGRKKKGAFEYRLRWDDVIYEPGELKAVAYKDGKEWARETVKTTGPAAKVLLQPDRSKIHADGTDLSYVTVTIADKDGALVPRSKNPVKFEISGPGKILAVDNGDATSFEPFQAEERKAFNGLALVIVQSTKEAGPIVLKATSPGLQPAGVKIQSVGPDE